MSVPATSARVGTGKRAGFTLVELLVVIGIITVLIAMLFPVFNRMKERGRRAQCASNLRQIASAIFAYAGDHNGKLFHHRRSSIVKEYAHLPGYPKKQPTGNFFWDDLRNQNPNGEDGYIPPDLRSNGLSFVAVTHMSYPWFQWPNAPVPRPQDVEEFTKWPWEDQGGEGGFVESIFPRYLTTCKPLLCPSAKHFAFADSVWADQNSDPTTLERGLRATIGKSYQGRSAAGYFFLPSYLGAVYGRLGNKWENYGQGFYDSYYIQGYHAFVPDPLHPGGYDKLSPHGAMMWDIGSYWFFINMANGDSRMPHSNEGCHSVGGNFLYRDGSVVWYQYPWNKVGEQ